MAKNAPGRKAAIAPPAEPAAPPPGGVTRRIADEIRAGIIAGRLKTDERLPTEDELAATFRVSRPTIREALKRLTAQHLIRSRRGPGGGVFVNRPSLGQARDGVVGMMALLSGMGAFSLVDIAEIRHDLGLVCLRYAIQRRTNDDIAAMEEQLLLQEDAGVADTAFCAADVGFHQAIAAASGNAVLSFVMQVVLQALMPPANMVVFRFRDRERIAAYHRRILLAVHARNGRAGEEAFTELMDYLRTKYAEAQDWRSRRDVSGSANSDIENS